jgi:microcystin-dependent protein
MSFYLGQIILMASDYAPEGWLPCDGRILQVEQNQALHSILRARFGGDDRKTFALPDLRNAQPIHTHYRNDVGKQRSSGVVLDKDAASPESLKYLGLMYCICVEGGDYPPKPEDY